MGCIAVSRNKVLVLNEVILSMLLCQNLYISINQDLTRMIHILLNIKKNAITLFMGFPLTFHY